MYKDVITTLGNYVVCTHVHLECLYIVYVYSTIRASHAQVIYVQCMASNRYRLPREPKDI
jgi:hypothetical protein